MTSGNGTQHGDWDTQREQLSAYLDGELEAEERQRLEAHLMACADCQRELAELRQTRQLLRALPAPALPRSFTLPVPEAAPARDTRAAAVSSRRARSGEWVARAAQWVGGIAAAVGLMLLLGAALAAGGSHSLGGAASGYSVPSTARPPVGASSADGSATHAPEIGVGSGATRTPPSSPSSPAPAVTATQMPPSAGSGDERLQHPYGLSNAPAAPLAGAGLMGGGIVLLAGGTVARRRSRRRNRRHGDGRNTRG